MARPTSEGSSERAGERAESPPSHRGVVIAVLAACALLYAWLRDASLLLPQQGIHCVLAADSLRHGRGFEVLPGLPFAKFGPLYPLLLAPLASLGLGVSSAVYLVNCAALAAALLALHALARALGLRHAWLAPALYAGLAPTWYLLRAARPDALMVAAALVALAFLVSYAERRRRSALLAAGAACAAAALARYMALFTLLPVAVAAVAWLAGPTLRARAREASLLACVALLPAAIWLARNLVVTGFVFGMSRTSPRPQAFGTTLGANAWSLIETLALDLFGVDALGLRIVVYDDVPLPHPWLFGAAAAAGLACAAAALWPVRGALADRARTAVGARTREGAALALVAGYTGLYLAALLALWTLGNNDPIHTRFVAPVYGGILLLVLAAGRVAGEGPGGGWRRAALAGCALAVMLPSLPKSVALLGESPSVRLIEVTTRRSGVPRWHRDVRWDLRESGRPGRPLLRRLRDVDE